MTPCSSNPCLHAGECTIGLNTSDYVCSCPEGFTGANCHGMSFNIIVKLIALRLWNFIMVADYMCNDASN